MFENKPLFVGHKSFHIEEHDFQNSLQMIREEKLDPNYLL